MHRLPVVVVGGTRTSVLHVYLKKRIKQFAPIHPHFRVSPSSSLFLFLRRTAHGRCRKRNPQLTLPPPPRHCPVRMIAERPPSDALGRPTYMRVVCEPGAMCFRHCIGYRCAGSFCVVGPASSTSIRRFLSAIERRLAMTHPAVPPATHTSSQPEEKGERGWRTARYNNIIFFVDCGGK